jgi:hypothetical protein
MISLTRSDNGLPVSTFGTGAAMSSSGGAVNGGGGSITAGNTFGQSARLFGQGLSNLTPAPATQGTAGDTSKFGYSTLGSSARGARGGRGAGMGGSGRPSTIPALGTDESIGVPDADPAKLPGHKPEATPVYQVEAPPPQQGLGETFGRVKNFAQGAWSGRPSGSTSDGTGPPDAGFGSFGEDATL